VTGPDGDSNGDKPQDGEDIWTDDRDELGGAEELSLSHDDERLPWLESADEEDDAPAFDTPKLIAFAIFGVLLLAVLLGGVWYAGNRSASADVAEADGSTISAPPGDYKQKPTDPGGKTFAGTGDTSFAVGEGQTREGRLAEAPPKPTPAPAPTPTPSPSAAADKPADPPKAAASSPAPAASGGVAVQVGAYSTKESAEAGWRKLLSQTDKLSGVKYRIVEGQADIGTVHRLQAVAGSRAAAQNLCQALKGDGVACQVK